MASKLSSKELSTLARAVDFNTHTQMTDLVANDSPRQADLLEMLQRPRDKAGRKKSKVRRSKKLLWIVSCAAEPLRALLVQDVVLVLERKDAEERYQDFN
ncbi:hypothetical protein E4U58_005470 [Claviceps cyperi]|nr:hypothetical protein E4U58_005470 [Claviceps cyperi]